MTMKIHGCELPVAVSGIVPLDRKAPTTRAWDQHRRADRLGESRRGHQAGEHEAEREDAERAEDYGSCKAEQVYAHHARKKPPAGEHEQREADDSECELHRGG